MPYCAFITCEHASNAVPPDVDLGLGDDALASHAAWDPGAREVATRLAERFGLACLLGEWTRALVDLNRSPDTAEAVPARLFGVDVPGNAALDATSRAARIESWHAPYWRRAAGWAEAALGRGERVYHLTVHSFVEVYEGRRREVDLGLLFDPGFALEARLASQLRAGLDGAGLRVRDNEPWDGRADGIATAFRHRFDRERYASLELELSQRLLPELDRVVEVLARALAATEPFSGRWSTPR